MGLNILNCCCDGIVYWYDLHPFGASADAVFPDYSQYRGLAGIFKNQDTEAIERFGWTEDQTNLADLAIPMHLAGSPATDSWKGTSWRYAVDDYLLTRLNSADVFVNDDDESVAWVDTVLSRGTAGVWVIVTTQVEVTSVNAPGGALANGAPRRSLLKIGTTGSISASFEEEHPDDFYDRNEPNVLAPSYVPRIPIFFTSNPAEGYYFAWNDDELAWVWETGGITNPNSPADAGVAVLLNTTDGIRYRTDYQSGTGRNLTVSGSGPYYISGIDFWELPSGFNGDPVLRAVDSTTGGGSYYVINQTFPTVFDNQFDTSLATNAVGYSEVYPQCTTRRNLAPTDFYYPTGVITPYAGSVPVRVGLGYLSGTGTRAVEETLLHTYKTTISTQTFASLTYYQDGEEVEDDGFQRTDIAAHDLHENNKAAVYWAGGIENRTIAVDEGGRHQSVYLHDNDPHFYLNGGDVVLKQPYGRNLAPGTTLAPDLFALPEFELPDAVSPTPLVKINYTDNARGRKGVPDFETDEYPGKPIYYDYLPAQFFHVFHDGSSEFGSIAAVIAYPWREFADPVTMEGVDFFFMSGVSSYAAVLRCNDSAAVIGMSDRCCYIQVGGAEGSVYRVFRDGAGVKASAVPTVGYEVPSGITAQAEAKYTRGSNASMYTLIPTTDIDDPDSLSVFTKAALDTAVAAAYP